MKTNGNKLNGNRPVARFKDEADKRQPNGKKTKAKDYFLNRKGISEKTIGELKKEKNKRAASPEIDQSGNKKLSGDRFLLTPYAYDEDFKGLAKFGACDFVIDGAIVGEKEEVVIKRKRGTCFYADFLKTDEKSDDRRPVRCKYFPSCGNCAFLHLAYDKQLALKRDMVKDSVSPYFANVGETVSTGEFEYRNKAHLAFAEADRRLVLGFFDDLTHAVIPIKKCLLHGEWFSAAAEIILEWARSHSFHAYNPRTGKGLLRYALLRHINGNLMLTLVVNGGKLSGIDGLYDALCSEFGKVSLFTCENKSAGSGVLSGKLRHEKGEEYLEGEMLGVKFTLSPDSFFQINEKTAEKIYSDVLEEIKNSPAEKVVDCFSGIGITSALFAKSGKEVISVEIVPSAVRDAKRIGALNGLSGNISYLCGDVEKLLPKIENVRNSVFFVDPPRAGLGARTALTITGFCPKEIIYLSCNPKTLKEDLKTFIENGYKITSVTPYDLFPETKHIETLVKFVRKI